MKKFKIVNDGKIEPLDGSQKIILDLASGKRKPQNKKEKKLLKQIKDIEARGSIIDLPFD